MKTDKADARRADGPAQAGALAAGPRCNAVAECRPIPGTGQCGLDPPHVVLLHQYFKPDGDPALPDRDTTWVNSGLYPDGAQLREAGGALRASCLLTGSNGCLSQPQGDHVGVRLGWPHLRGSDQADLGWKHYDNEETKDDYAWTADNAAGENRYVAALKALDARNRDSMTNVIEGYCLFCLGNGDPMDLCMNSGAISWIAWDA